MVCSDHLNTHTQKQTQLAFVLHLPEVQSLKLKSAAHLWACSCLYLKVVHQRTSETHFSQRHVGVAAVQEALDLRADVQSQSLSSLDLMWSECCPRVIVLLQPLLHTVNQWFRRWQVLTEQISHWDNLDCLSVQKQIIHAEGFRHEKSNFLLCFNCRNRKLWCATVRKRSSALALFKRQITLFQLPCYVQLCICSCSATIYWAKDFMLL